ncbi:SlyX family protein [Motiliproteus sp. SC1-56]|uniref:SlyX family protein n=1 Tax=Motiliproteus sp. SC1-56 TaxID=2799565 RepID=UPI001A8F3490|nr:SlyX family protein [Motiliproteus sp. SC1-56]
MQNPEERLIELETRTAFQEDTVQSLSDTVARQQRELDDLREMVRIINKQLKSLSEGHPQSVGEEPPPPHY